MSRFRAILLLLLLLCTIPAAGQDTDYYFRPFVGAGLTGTRAATWQYSGTVHPLTTPYYGVEVGMAVTDHWHICTGLSFLQTGYRVQGFIKPAGWTPVVTYDTVDLDIRFQQLLLPLGLRYHLNPGRRFFVGIQGALAPCIVTQLSEEVNKSGYEEFRLLGMLKADAGIRMGRTCFLSAGPSAVYTLTNIRNTVDRKKERHYVLAFDVGIGFMF